MPLLGITLRVTPSAWTTLQVAHIPTASTTDRLFLSHERGEEAQTTWLFCTCFRFPPLVFGLVL
jgi:hypothetical protein